MKKIHLIFLLALFLRLIFLDSSYFFWDETIYLAHGKLFSGINVGYSENFLRPPLVPLIISILAKFVYYELFSKILIILINSLIVYPIYFLAKLIDKKIVLISSVLSAILPISIINSRFVMTDHLSMLLGVSTITLFFYAVKDKKDTLFCVGSFFLGLSVLTKFTSLLFIILLAPFGIYLIKKPKIIVSSIIVFLLTLTPFLIYSFQQFKNPFYVFYRAFHVVQSSSPIDFSFFFIQFIDMFGIILSFSFIYGTYKLIKNKHINFFQKTIIFQTIVVTVYSFLIIFRGVAKPPGMEWEVQRIILILIPYVIILSCYGIHCISKSTKIKNTMPIVILSGLLLMSSNYSKVYTKSIDFEDGLRYVTKDMGIFLRNSDINNFSCVGNCPPVAYYSQIKMNHFYSFESLVNSDPDYVVLFKQTKEYTLMTKICHRNWCSYLYKKSE